MSTPAASPSLPADLAAAHAMILAERAKRIEAEAAASSVEAVIAHLKLTIEKLKLGDEGRTTLLTNGSTLIGIEAIDLALDVEERVDAGDDLEGNR